MNLNENTDDIMLDDNDIQAEQELLYAFTTLKESHLQKPHKDSVGKIVTRLDKSEADGISLLTLKENIENGYPCSPTFWNYNKRETDNIWAFSCFFLDFDNKDLENVISPDEALDMLYKQDIKPNFIYRTLSNTLEQPRFRIGFLLDKPIMIDSNTDIDSINSCYKLFQKFFTIKGKTVLDPNINAVSFFYGGTDFEILHEKPHDFNILYCFLDSFNNIYTKNNLSSPCPFQHSPTPLGQNGYTSIDIKDIQPKRPRELQGGSLTSESTEKALEDFQQEEDAPLNIINYIETLELALKPSRLEELKARKPENAKKRNKEWGFILLSYNIHCFYDFLYCKKKFHHDELFRLATNIIPIKGGALLMKTVMISFSELHPENPYDPKKLDILKWVKKHKPHPYTLSTFSKYEEDWKYGTLLNAIRNPSNKIFDNLDRECITLLTVDEARVLLDQYCTEAEASSQNRIIIKAPTGLGKTEALKSHFLDAYIGTKTNKLKNEIAERLGFISTTPDYPKFEDEQLKIDINKYDQIGLYQNSSKLIYDIADHSRKASILDYMAALSYTDANNRCYGELIVERFVTTHSRGIRDSGRFPQKTIVLDEDPMGDILNVKMAKIPDIAYLTKYDQQFQRELDYFISQEMHILYKYETCITLRDSYIRECILDEYRNISKGSYLYQLFSCHYFLKTDENTVIFVTENKVSSEKKSVIISATPNIEIYTRLYKTDLKVYSVENVISKGRIVQDSERSYTRQSIKNESNSELVSRKVKEINDNSAIEAVITFKGYRHHFPNKDTSIYFFSSEGTDKLKGKDIAVFGTPIIPPSTTLLYATLCGVIITEDDVKKMTYRKVEFDDFTFKFNTYVNPELSRIHLSLIQQELTQAVGRNRYLTEDCTVYLYSSFPIRVFNEKDVKATDDAGIIVLESSVEEGNIIDVIKPLQPKPIKRTPMTERLAPDKEIRREMKTDEQKTIPPIQKKQYTAEEDEELRLLLDELFK